MPRCTSVAESLTAMGGQQLEKTGFLKETLPNPNCHGRFTFSIYVNEILLIYHVWNVKDVYINLKKINACNLVSALSHPSNSKAPHRLFTISCWSTSWKTLQGNRLDMNRLQPLKGQEIVFICGPQTYKITRMMSKPNEKIRKCVVYSQPTSHHR